MSIPFDSQRSEAIRADLVAAAAPAVRQPRPWRGLILVLAGALVGSGATTAAFANSPAGDSSTPGIEVSPGGVVVPATAVDESSAGKGGAVTVTTDAGSGKVHVDYQPNKHLSKLSEQQLVVTEPAVLDLSGHPAGASYAWVSLACRDKGSIEVVNGKDGGSLKVGLEASGHGKVPAGPVMAMMLTLDKPAEQIRPIDGCVAEVAVTYFAKG